MGKKLDLVGQRFTRLEVLEEARTKQNERGWKCRCDCGNEIILSTRQLRTGNTMKELVYGNGVSDTRVDLVNFALQFVGNRYVWGGTSLTKGVDCSGFTMKIYQKYVSLPIIHLVLSKAVESDLL